MPPSSEPCGVGHDLYWPDETKTAIKYIKWMQSLGWRQRQCRKCKLWTFWEKNGHST